MTEGISQSRFNMWRAILALIHADGVIRPEEIEFMEHYLSEIDFSEEQKEILRSDLTNPQNVGEVYQEVTVPEDRGQFFMFARMLIWCDGDLHAQEEAIFNHLMENHMGSLDKDKLKQHLASSRDDGRLVRILEDENFKHQAREKVGIIAILKDWFTF